MDAIHRCNRPTQLSLQHLSQAFPFCQSLSSMAEADAVTLGSRDYEDGNTFTISSLNRSVFRHL